MIRKALLLGAVGMLISAAAYAYTYPPVIDLTTAGSSSGILADGTIWNTLSTDPTGTGVYNPFLREQNNGIEEGLNSDASPPPFDDKAGIWTHSLTLGQLQVSNVGGIDYYRFTLDFNEPNNANQALLSLDEFRLYTSGTLGGSVLASDIPAMTLRYDLDATIDQDVFLNYLVSRQGSGQDDMEVFIPTSYFAGAASTDNLYLYAKFGASTGYGADDASLPSQDGFEEWRADLSAGSTGGSSGSTGGSSGSAPEPGTLMLLGTGLVGLMASRKK